MLESKLIDLLNNFLEPYIDGIDQTKLQLKSLLGGKVILNDLHLKPGVVDFLELPFHLTFGLIGQLTIRLNFRILNLSKTKLVLDINDVILLLTTVPESQWDPIAYRNEYIASKIATLASESLQLVVKEIQGGGFFWKAMVSFMETLEIVIKNIHIRIEDYITNPNVSYAFGCVIKKAVFRTEAEGSTASKKSNDIITQVKAPFQSAFYTENGNLCANILHRTIDLEGVGFYIDQLEPLSPGLVNGCSTENVSCGQIGEFFSNDDINFEDLDESKFVDAISHSHSVRLHPQNIRGTSNKPIQKVRYLSLSRRENHGPRIRVTGEFYRRPLQSKRRLQNYGLSGARYKSSVRCKYGLAYRPRSDYELPNYKKMGIIGHHNILYTAVLSNIMEFLVTGAHRDDCGRTSLNGWQGNRAGNSSRGTFVSTRKLHQSNMLYCRSPKYDMYTKQHKDALDVKLARKTRKLHRIYKNKLEFRKSRDDAGVFPCFPGASSDVIDGHNGIYRQMGLDWKDTYFPNLRCLSSGFRRDSEFSISSVGSTFMDGFGYGLSSRSSWRVLLSTFCNIRQPTNSQHNNSLDILLKAQMRRRRRECDCFAAEDGKFADDGLCAADETASITNSSQKGRLGMAGFCKDIDCTTFDTNSNDFYSHDSLDEPKGSLSYDENWHVRFNAKEDCISADREGSSEIYAGFYGSPTKNNCSSKAKGSLRDKESWTKLTFVVNSGASPELKELFLRALEETDHNYILNPKDFKGVASFYFCSNLTLPLRKPRSCWSSWGEKLHRPSAASNTDEKECLPRCSIFMVLEDLNLTISKEQFGCIMNLVYENIYKYYNWEAGIIYTFESPRATPKDEKMYMEYWPQYLLLNQSDSPNKLKEFMMDFEVLHSIQAIRVLRGSASEALRNIISRFRYKSGHSSYGAYLGDYVTDVLVTSVCRKYDDKELELNRFGTESGYKLHSRLQLVGGIYEIAAKHAKPAKILDSLHKILKPHTLTVDIAFDLVLLNSCIIFTSDMDPGCSNTSNVEAHVLTASGLHFFIKDVYSREGSQFIELELFPFSLLSLGLCIHRSAEFLSTMDCACRLLDGPATVLVSCGDASTLSSSKVPEKSKKRWNLRSIVKKPTNTGAALNNFNQFQNDGANSQIKAGTESSLYFAVEFNRFCIPEQSDMRVLFHLSSDIFIHLRFMGELDRYLLTKKYCVKNYATLTPIRVASEDKRLYYIERDYFDITEVYELIDLGIEYYKNLIQSSVPFVSIDFVIEDYNQTLLLLDWDQRCVTFPHFLSIDSFSVTSENSFRLSDTMDYPHCSHTIKISNINYFCCYGDYSFLSDNGSRLIYMGPFSSISLVHYLKNVVFNTPAASVCNFSEMPSLLNIFERNVSIFSLGKDIDVFINLKCMNSLCGNRGLPCFVATISLGTVCLSLRDIDIMDILEAYSGFMAKLSDYNSYINSFENIKGKHGLSSELPAVFLDTCDSKNYYTSTEPAEYETAIETEICEKNSILFNGNFRKIVSEKWGKLQLRLQKQKRDHDAIYGVKYEFAVDFIYLEFKRSIKLENVCFQGKQDSSDSPSVLQQQNSNSSNFIPGIAFDKFTANSQNNFTPLSNSDSNSNVSGGIADFSKLFLSILKSPHNSRVIYEDNDSGCNPFHNNQTVNEALGFIDESLRCYGIASSLLSIKVTGFGVNVGFSVRGIECLRAFVGCVEVEDQSNSLPLYMSMIFSGGDVISLWKWLKVKREINEFKANLSSCKGNGDDSASTSTKNILKIYHKTKKTGDTDKKYEKLKSKLKHIDIDGIGSDCNLRRDHCDILFKLNDDSISGAYETVQRYLRSFMGRDSVSDRSYINRFSGHTDSSRCYITVSVDRLDSGLRSAINFSNGVCNVSWEFIDEILNFLMKIWRYVRSIPHWDEPSVANLKRTNDFSAQKRDLSSNIDLVISVEKSCLNILVDSAWFGYANFIKYMWYKLLSSTFNLVDRSNHSDSRRTSIMESRDSARNNLYMNTARKHEYSSNSRTRNQVNNITMHLDHAVNSGRKHLRGNIIPSNKVVTSSKLFPNCEGVGLRIRWYFVRFVLTDRLKQAYLIPPISLKLSGACYIHCKFSVYRLGVVQSSRECKNIDKDIPDGISVSDIPKLKRCRNSSTKIKYRKNLGLLDAFKDYMPCRIHFRMLCTNVSAEFMRGCSGNIFSSCGYNVFNDRDLDLSESFKKHRFDFMKYIHLNRPSDQKFHGLLELSKNTLYDLSKPHLSKFMDSFRFEITSSINLCAPDVPFCNGIAPRSISVVLKSEVLDMSLTCVDVLCFIEISSLIGRIYELAFAEDTFFIGPSNKVFSKNCTSVTLSSDFSCNIQAGSAPPCSLETDEFHSCSSIESDSDWVSVLLTDDDIIPCGLLSRELSVVEKQKRNKHEREDSGSLDFFVDFLSLFCVGLQLDAELIDIKLYSSYLKGSRQIFVATIEDFKFSLWTNNVDQLSMENTHMEIFGPAKLGEHCRHDHEDYTQHKFFKFNEFSSLSDIYASEIREKISLCTSECCTLFSTDNLKILDPLAEPFQGYEFFINTAEDLEIDESSPLHYCYLVRFECSLCITVDICKDSAREMTLETVKIYFRGHKPTLQSPIFSSLSASWINFNVTLNLAHCLFGFMSCFFEMVRLRNNLLENSYAEFLEIQPATNCSLNAGLKTTMIPSNLFPSNFKFYPGVIDPLNQSLVHSKVADFPRCFEFRLNNGLINRLCFLNLHETLAAKIYRLSALNVGKASKINVLGMLHGDGAVMGENSITEIYDRDEEVLEKNACLFNNLGQPIAVCTDIFASNDPNPNCKWSIVPDGGSFILPAGHYGILLPFVVRIQLNNCVYELPSSLFNASQDDEVILRLDISRKYPKDQRQTRMKFMRNKRHEKTETLNYTFGVDPSRARFIDGTHYYSQNCPANYKIRKQAFLKSMMPTEKRSGRLRDNFARMSKGKMRISPRSFGSCKFAYIMVQTSQRLGVQTTAGSTPQTQVNVYLSSALWMSNKSQEDVVIFPSITSKRDHRLIPIASLVWLNLQNPLTDSLPISRKILGSTKIYGSVKAAGDRIFKQIANIQDLKWHIRRLQPAHILDSPEVSEELSVSDFKLQCLPVSRFSFKQTRVYIPLSWTIEPSCTICVALQKDFPSNLDATFRKFFRFSSRNDARGINKNSRSLSLLDYYFFGDVLLSGESAQYLYDSFEHQRTKIPIPGHTAQVNLGKSEDFGASTDINGIYSGELGPRISANDVTTRSEVGKGEDSQLSSANNFAIPRLESGPTYYAESHEDLKSASVLEWISDGNSSDRSFECTDIPADDNFKASRQRRNNSGDFLGAFALSEDKSIVYTSRPQKNCRASHEGLFIRRTMRKCSVLSKHSRSKSVAFSKLDDGKFDKISYIPPSVILSSTLVELTSVSKSPYLRSSKQGTKHFEIVLENCHIIENMMPYDIYMITLETFELLNSFGHPNLEDDFYWYSNGKNEPLCIRAGDSTRFSLYIKSGRFLIKELISREFKLKMTNENLSENLVFEAMQPNLLKSAMFFINKYDTSSHGECLGTLPRRIVVSLETNCKTTDAINDGNGSVKRYLASSQIVHTLFTEQWIVNWLDYPISVCRSDGRYQQTITAHSCTLVSQDLSSTELQLAIKKTNLRLITNFDSYPKKGRRSWFSFDHSSGTHAMSNTFKMPDLAFSTCSFRDTQEIPNLHYLISTCMAPVPFFRTSILEILPQVTLTNEFPHAIWIRETDSHKTGVIKLKKRDAPWYMIDSGLTIEFHSQIKGDLSIEITGINPDTMNEDYCSNLLLRYLADSVPKFCFWSCGIPLKQSCVIKFRYPSKLNAVNNTDNSISRQQEHGKLNFDLFSRLANEKVDKSGSVKYGLCDMEIQTHKGAKMVRFMKATAPDWILLNSTGIDLWVEQQGVMGYGEIIHFVSNVSDFSSEYFASRGLPFTWYDPFEDHKLLFRFHLVQCPSKYSFSIQSKYDMRKNFKSIRDMANINRMSPYFNQRYLKKLVSNEKFRNVRVKGSLVIDLSRVESVNSSSVCKIRFGKIPLRIRLNARTFVMYGQKTLQLTATRLVSRGLSNFIRSRNSTLVGDLYNKLKSKYGISPEHISNLGTKNPLSSNYNWPSLSLAKSRIKKSKISTGCRNEKNKLYNRGITQKNKLNDIGLFDPGLKTKKPRKLNYDYVIQTNILGLGISFCSQLPEELLYLSFTLIKFKASLEGSDHRHTLSLGWLQSDVHDPSTCYPTMLRPMTDWHSDLHGLNLGKKEKVIREMHTKTINNKRRGILTVLFNTRGNKHFKFREITNFSIELEPMNLNLDTRVTLSFLLLLDKYLSIFGLCEGPSDYFTTAGVGIFSNVDSWLRNFDMAQYQLREVAKSRFSNSAHSVTKYNISKLHVGRLAVVINIRRSGTSLLPEFQPTSAMIRYMMHIIRRTPHISDANIILAQESLLELCCTPYALFTHFAMRYISQSVQQIYKVLGAIDLIGNPKIVLHHWISGFSQSIAGIHDALRYAHLPPMVVFLLFKAVSRFGLSLFSGLVDAFYRSTGSWYLLLNTLARNSDRYAVLLMQEIFRKPLDQPSNIMEGIVLGGKAVGRNLYISLGNFALKPLHAIFKFFGAITSAKGINADVMKSGIHIFGSALSGVASLTFGSLSSILSGVSVTSQGILNQINFVPMLSAIRPGRSLQLLRMPGPTRYNFLESWSMEANRKIDGISEILLILPLGRKAKLFDPAYMAPPYWTALCEEVGNISPLTTRHPSLNLLSFFWVDRLQMGYIERGKVKWKCNNKDILSIEIYEVLSMQHQSKRAKYHEDSILISMNPKVAKKHYNNVNTYYLRIVHVGSYSGQSSKKDKKKIPSAVLDGFSDPKTFPNKQKCYDYLQEFVNNSQNAESYDIQDSNDHSDTCSDMTARSGEHINAVQSYYTEKCTNTEGPFSQGFIKAPFLCGDIISDRYSRGFNGSGVAPTDIDMYERTPAVIEICRKHADASPSSATRTEFPNSCPQKYHENSRNEKGGIGGNLRTVPPVRTRPIRRIAETIWLPSMETAMLYFTLLISVLKEASL